MVSSHIDIDNEALIEFCERHHIAKLAFFGSVTRKDFKPESDIDVLVEFESGHVPGFGFFDIEQELSDLLGHKVDLNTPKFLSRYFRDEVMATADVRYAKAR